MLLFANGFQLLPWKSYNGSKERHKDESYPYVLFEMCENHWLKQQALNELEKLEFHIPEVDEEINRFRQPKQKNVSGYLPIREEIETYHRKVSQFKSVYYLDKIRAEIRTEIETDKFGILVELPITNSDIAEQEINCWLIRRYLSNIGESAYDKLKSTKYMHCSPKEGDIQKFWEDAQNGVRCVYCGGFWDRSYGRYVACTNCTGLVDKDKYIILLRSI